MAEDGVTVQFAAKNDRGYDWWTTDGKLVLEDPEYCASVAFTVGSWIEMLTKYSARLILPRTHLPVPRVTTDGASWSACPTTDPEALPVPEGEIP